MKKILAKIICAVLSLCVICSGLIACGDGETWKAGELTNGGKMLTQGGFVAESENYLYFINGSAANSSNNAFGSPIKGSLMAVKKSDLGTSGATFEVVVPKIFSATDSKAGLFIDGDNGYVYYGTPNTEKNASGNVAHEEMCFARTKLDGSGQTDYFFTVSSHTLQYRIIKSGESVYIVYYDENEKALISYDTASKTATTIAKTSVEAESLSLQGYMFVDGANAGDGVVLFTTTVYAQPFSEKDAQKIDYVRATEKYNQVYLYKVGDVKAEGAEVVGTKVLDGKTDDVFALTTYSLSLFQSGYLFYKSTPVQGEEKTYAATLAELKATSQSLNKGTFIKNSTHASSKNIIKSLSSVYVLENDVVYHTSLTEAEATVKKPVAKTGTISTLLFVKDAELYYYNSSSQLAKIKLKDVEGGASLSDEVNEVRVSEDTVASAWYKPQVMSVGGKEYIFYLDNSALGSSYVKYVALDAPVVEKEDTSTVYYLDTSYIKLLGKKTNDDLGKEVTTRIEDISLSFEANIIVFDDPDAQTLEVKEVAEVRELLNSLNDKAKGAVSSEAKQMLKLYEKAIEIANKYNKLKGIEQFNSTDYTVEDIPESIKTAYNEIKNEIENFKASDIAGDVDDLIGQNYKYYYQVAKEIFE